MASTEMIAAAKKAARMTTDYYDSEVARLLDAAVLDLGVAGVIPNDDSLVTQAAITYFLMNFGQPENYDRLKRSYDEQKAQLATKTGYTLWTEAIS
jgi:hypothetical protein